MEEGGRQGAHLVHRAMAGSARGVRTDLWFAARRPAALQTLEPLVRGPA
jgi:hypothetical protein